MILSHQDLLDRFYHAERSYIGERSVSITEDNEELDTEVRVYAEANGLISPAPPAICQGGRVSKNHPKPKRPNARKGMKIVEKLLGGELVLWSYPVESDGKPATSYSLKYKGKQIQRFLRLDIGEHVLDVARAWMTGFCGGIRKEKGLW